MKVGSIVELVDDNWSRTNGAEVYPVRNKVYTVRDFSTTWSKGPSLWLVEITNKKAMHLKGFTEPSFRISRFRELLPPIANIEEHINANVLTEEVV